MDEEAYAGLSAVALAAAVTRRETAAAEVAAAALGRIARLEPSLRAFREVWADEARARAAEVDRRVAAGERLPLAGVPIGVKGTAGLRAGPARRLLAAGCVAVGATSVPGPGTRWQTWGLGAGGRTANPWRPDRSPGGSSAGSAAAVAAGMVPVATGTDGAGSVRIPAAWCGVLGLKTTNGRLPTADRSGLAAPGVLVRHAADLAAWLECVLGVRAGNAGGGAGGTGGPVTAVWSPDLGYAESEAEVVRVVREAVDRLAAAGVVRLVPPAGEAGAVLLDPGPAWLALRGPGGERTRADMRADMRADTRADRARAERTRAENDGRLDALLAGARLLLTPATPNRPHGHDGPGERYSTALTWAFNLSGHPAVSVPAGLTGDGCPAGLQIVAARGAEPLLAGVVRAAEDAGLVVREPGEG
ncbi:amidase family protein [Streptomyces sp. DH37]|uniref:amidase family protein n=1 Tax=Streptomyces sp. DH37 TaxID=3040122 RepID=UPI0024418AD0|nr:amidase family protein [Streptomyces sp. DH37]MDG9704354.1 amidase family protein [Streptomyces sp. DH37]